MSRAVVQARAGRASARRAPPSQAWRRLPSWTCFQKIARRARLGRGRAAGPRAFSYLQGLVLKKSQDERVSVAVAQPGHCFFENGRELVPDRLRVAGFGFDAEFHEGLLFTLLAAEFTPADIGAGKQSGAVEPAGQRSVRGQRTGLAREENKHRLGDVP